MKKIWVQIVGSATLVLQLNKKKIVLHQHYRNLEKKCRRHCRNCIYRMALLFGSDDRWKKIRLKASMEHLASMKNCKLCHDSIIVAFIDQITTASHLGNRIPPSYAKAYTFGLKLLHSQMCNHWLTMSADQQMELLEGIKFFADLYSGYCSMSCKE